MHTDHKYSSQIRFKKPADSWLYLWAVLAKFTIKFTIRFKKPAESWLYSWTVFIWWNLSVFWTLFVNCIYSMKSAGFWNLICELYLFDEICWFFESYLWTVSIRWNLPVFWTLFVNLIGKVHNKIHGKVHNKVHDNVHDKVHKFGS